MDIYDRNGKPMSPEAFEAVPFKKRILKQTRLVIRGDLITVLTMWDGIDNSNGSAHAPLPFSTFAYSEHYPNMTMAVPTQDQALIAHEMVCGFVRSQGGKSGWRVFAYFMSKAWRSPKGVKMGWFNVAISALLVLLQLQSLTWAALSGTWHWAHLFPASMLLLWSWLFANSLRGLKGKLKERREERRIEREKTEFENIIGPIR